MTPRVLHVLEALEGGTARHLVDVVRHSEGVEHHVAIPSRRVGWITDEAAPAQIAAAGGTVHTIEMRRSPLSPRNASALVQLRRLARRLTPDVVHGHSSAGGALARVAAAGLGAARVYTANGIATGRAAIVVERALGHLTDRFVAVSASEGELAVARRLVRPDRLTVIPNGIDLAAPPAGPDLRAMLGVGPAVPLVGTIARLVPQKAPEVFVRACGVVAARHPDAHHVLIGSGPQLALLESELRALDLGDRFHHVPFMEEASSVLHQLDVFVLASRFEGGPYTPLEAIRAGTAVVLSDAVGNRDVVEHGVSGLVVPVGDAVALGDAIASLLADPARRASMVERAEERLRSRFDVRAMGRALTELYRDLSAPGRGAGRRSRRRSAAS